MRNGQPQRDYTLWSDGIATTLHSCREICRNLRQKFDGYYSYTAHEVNSMYSIQSLSFLTTEKPSTFSWL